MRCTIWISTITLIFATTPCIGFAADESVGGARLEVIKPAVPRVAQLRVSTSGKATKRAEKQASAETTEGAAKVDFVVASPAMEPWIKPAEPTRSSDRMRLAADPPTLRIVADDEAPKALVVKKELPALRNGGNSVVRVAERTPKKQSTTSSTASSERATRMVVPPAALSTARPDAVAKATEVDAPSRVRMSVPETTTVEAAPTLTAKTVTKPTEPAPHVASASPEKVAEPKSRMVATTPRVQPIPAAAPQSAANVPSSTESLPSAPTSVAVAKPARVQQPFPDRYPPPIAYRAPLVTASPRGRYPAVPFAGRGLPPAAPVEQMVPRDDSRIHAQSDQASVTPNYRLPSTDSAEKPFRQASFENESVTDTLAASTLPPPSETTTLPTSAHFEHGDLVDDTSYATCESCGVPLGGCPGPRWIVDADAMFLGRNDPDTRTALVTRDPPGPAGPKDFTPSDASLGAGFGYRLGLSYQICSGSSLNVQYFRVDNWNQTKQFTGDLDVLGNPLGNPSDATWIYGSDLTNAEINGRHAVTPWLGFIGGFRWIELDDRASLNSGGPLIASFNRRISTDNTLLGGQLGFDYLLFDMGGVFRVDTTLKIGVFNNEMTLASAGFGAGNRTENHTTVAGDFQLRGVWQIAPNLSVTGGYYLLGLNDVALAPEQFVDPTQIRDDGDVLIQGGTLGLMWVY